MSSPVSRLRVLLALAGAALLGACIPSVNPFYAEADIVADDRLLGTWHPADDDSKDLWTFERRDDHSYRLVIREEKGKHGSFVAVLFRAGSGTFLDLQPARFTFADDETDLVAAAVIPGHLLVRVRSLEPQLKLSFFDWDWLGRFLEEHPEALAHRREAHSEMEAPVLTAATPELQRFVLEHLGEGELFGKAADAGTLDRAPAAAPPPPGAPTPPAP